MSLLESSHLCSFQNSAFIWHKFFQISIFYWISKCSSDALWLLLLLLFIIITIYKQWHDELGLLNLLAWNSIFLCGDNIWPMHPEFWIMTFNVCCLVEFLRLGLRVLLAELSFTSISLILILSKYASMVACFRHETQHVNEEIWLWLFPVYVRGDVRCKAAELYLFVHNMHNCR